MEGDTSRYSDIVRTMGQSLFDKIHASKVLVVGAGGIGCELLKNLVMMGFEDIEIVPATFQQLLFSPLMILFSSFADRSGYNRCEQFESSIFVSETSRRAIKSESK